MVHICNQMCYNVNWVVQSNLQPTESNTMLLHIIHSIHIWICVWFKTAVHDPASNRDKWSVLTIHPYIDWTRRERERAWGHWPCPLPLCNCQLVLPTYEESLLAYSSFQSTTLLSECCWSQTGSVCAGTFSIHRCLVQVSLSGYLIWDSTSTILPICLFTGFFFPERGGMEFLNHSAAPPPWN